MSHYPKRRDYTGAASAKTLILKGVVDAHAWRNEPQAIANHTMLTTCNGLYLFDCVSYSLVVPVVTALGDDATAVDATAVDATTGSLVAVVKAGDTGASLVLMLLLVVVFVRASCTRIVLSSTNLACFWSTSTWSLASSVCLVSYNELVMSSWCELQSRRQQRDAPRVAAWHV